MHLCLSSLTNSALELSLSLPQLYVSPSLTAFVLMVVPPIACLAVIFGKFIRSISRRTQDALAEATQVRGHVSFQWGFIACFIADMKLSLGQ